MAKPTLDAIPPKRSGASPITPKKIVQVFVILLSIVSLYCALAMIWDYDVVYFKMLATCSILISIVMLIRNNQKL